MTDTMRDALESAISEHDEEQTDDQNTATGEETGQPDEGSHSSDEATEERADSTVAGTEPDAGAEEAGEADAEAGAEPDPNNSVKAPVNWSPAEREHWSKIPRQYQDKIVAREAEMEKAMEGTAVARKTHDAMERLGEAYAPVLAAEGAENPIAAAEHLFKYVAGLRMGTPAQKANIIAQVIQQYGIDIDALDMVLSGQPAADPAQNQMMQLIDQRMAPVNQLLETMQGNQASANAARETEVGNELATFQKTAEFMDDVRMDMADILDMASKNGRDMSLQEAYTRACSFNPEVSKILDSRKAAADLTGNQTNMQDKANAASSIAGKQSGTGGGAENMSLRATLEDAWNS